MEAQPIIKSDIVIGVAAHKKYQMPASSSYYPIFVGSEGKADLENYVRDDQGDNISKLNPYFCELTATYFLWKNVQADYKGLVHYRRQFSNKNHFGTFQTGNFDIVLDDQKLKQLLQETDIIVPEKRNYYIETNYSHYAHAHNGKDMDTTRDIISELYPDYVGSFDKVMKSTSAHMFNMYIMKSQLFDDYAKWLFDILFELQKRADISQYSVQEQRLFGYVSELLLDVWLDQNQLSYKEVPVMFMEKQDWIKKGTGFIKRKFAGNK